MINDVSYKHYLKKKAVFLSISSDTCFELGENLRLFLCIHEEPYSFNPMQQNQTAARKMYERTLVNNYLFNAVYKLALLAGLIMHTVIKLPDINKTLEINKLRCCAIKYSLIEQAQKFQSFHSGPRRVPIANHSKRPSDSENVYFSADTNKVVPRIVSIKISVASFAA